MLMIFATKTLGELRPPWLRQIIIPILSAVKMLSLAGERLTPKVLTTVMSFFSSFTHLRISGSPPQFNQFFIVLPRTPP